jgi:hypothetical protein
MSTQKRTLVIKIKSENTIDVSNGWQIAISHAERYTLLMVRQPNGSHTTFELTDTPALITLE